MAVENGAVGCLEMCRHLGDHPVLLWKHQAAFTPRSESAGERKLWRFFRKKLPRPSRIWAWRSMACGSVHFFLTEWGAPIGCDLVTVAAGE